MRVVRDVFDKGLLDREDESMGRVDGMIMYVGENTQPRITHIVIGGSALWDRVHPVFGKLSKRLARMWGPKRASPVRIPWSRVKTVGRDIKLEVEAKETGAIDWEIWIAKNIIERIPGSGSDEEDDGD